MTRKIINSIKKTQPNKKKIKNLLEALEAFALFKKTFQIMFEAWNYNTNRNNM